MTPHHQHVTRLLALLRSGKADANTQADAADMLEQFWRERGVKA